MNNLKRSLQYSLIILFVSVYLVACQSVTPTPLSGAPTPGISLNITASICPSSTVTTGDQITWTNQDQQVHLIHRLFGKYFFLQILRCSLLPMV